MHTEPSSSSPTCSSACGLTQQASQLDQQALYAASSLASGCCWWAPRQVAPGDSLYQLSTAQVLGLRASPALAAAHTLRQWGACSACCGACCLAACRGHVRVRTPWTSLCMQVYTESTDGTYIEVKESALVWHYAGADPDFGSWQASRPGRAHDAWP